MTRALVEGPSGLVCVAVALDEDQFARARSHAYAHGRVIEHEHHALLTWDVAARISLPFGTSDAVALGEVTAVLRAIARRSEDLDDAATPLALGALCFDPNAPGVLTVPTYTAQRRAGEPARLVVVCERDDLPGVLAGFPFDASESTSATEGDPPDTFTLTSTRSHRDFREKVAAAVTKIRAGELEKVVLAREVLVRANRPFSQRQLLERMHVLYPSCAAFAIDGFLGASPELLCRRQGALATAHPLAGTVPRSGDPDDDERLAKQLLASDKDRAEHAFVVDAITAALAPFAEGAVVAEGPHLLELRNVAHLATTVRATLRERPSGSLPSALELVGVLHPTPAVGGVPRDEALSYIAKHEDFDRGRYAGPLGFVDAAGDGEWWLGIRSATVEHDSARLLAGVGIVASSNPEDELIETQLKLQALLATAVRP